MQSLHHSLGFILLITIISKFCLFITPIKNKARIIQVLLWLSTMIFCKINKIGCPTMR
jgi:hypothetical protein